MKRKIAILFHENARGLPLEYLINRYAELWSEDGHEVRLLFGVREFVSADVVIVHVDLTVVPDEYLEFARRYPVALNAEVKDIRKSAYSSLLLKAGDPYDGRVIVKSNFNYAAHPERALGVPLDPRGVSSSYFWSPLDYQIYDTPKAVPPLLFDDPNVVVEKFQPEIEDGLYVTRSMLFLGDRIVCNRLASPNPIVNSSTQVRLDRVEPHPDIVKMRTAMRFDYGKFDYVVRDGQALLLDANKTMGAGNYAPTPQRLANRRFRAEGLYSYFARLAESVKQ